MARPRPVLKNRIYLITRRCARRQLLLTPSPEVNQAVWYCLAEAAQHTGVELLAFVALGNHHHAVVRDREGFYPLFLRRFHRNLAKVVNCRLGRWGNLWGAEQTSVVTLEDDEAVLDKIIYTLANPVAAHLVRKAGQWPGATSLPYQLSDEEVVARRPAWFFAEKSTMPEVVRLRFARPPAHAHLRHETWTAKLERAIAERERLAQRERRRSDADAPDRVLGVQRVLDQSPFSYPKTHEPKRRISPRVASKNKWRRIEAIQRNEAWQAAYRAALTSHRSGDKQAIFPPGTWQLYQDGHVRRRAA
jgi:hypothetical protein